METATLQEPLWAISALMNMAALKKQTSVLPKEYRVRQDLNQEPPMGMIFVLKHMSAIKKQRLVLPKEYRDKQDLIQEPAMGVISVLKHIKKQHLVLPQ